ncbi:ABC transporter ATP-binding protein [Amycolatopsis rhabdoformis]|uniref:ABC transporter ATP-binding protein n=1 Tax=Amycolatopsis rhabdoformis TaxID=1448059 RepID=A0ABZ1HWG3_9PSEU|nr:ABC transporter ATP-binding protein [Amycolatopsis rhabdoformis]WSE26535.1 ABC transporter ATP-binding protein [Amycolatopsis rhabdoformis]
MSLQRGGGVSVVGDPVLLRAEGLCVSFGGLEVLRQVSLEVSTGCVLGVIGPNGAGKTTLFNTICGFVRPDSGAITFAGQSLDRPRPERLTRHGIARTLQGLGLFAGLTVLDNVVAGATHRSRTGLAGALLASPWADKDERALADRAMDVLRRLGIDGEAKRICAGLPYGVRKRVALARALVSEPRLLLLDEPAAGLSATEVGELADIVRGLAPATTVMLVEHHMDFVMNLCDSLVVLDFGEVIARGTPAQVRADPQVQRAYLGDPVAAVAGEGGAHA